MVEFGTSSAFREWVRVWVLGYDFGVRGREVRSRDCALASDLVNGKSPPRRWEGCRFAAAGPNNVRQMSADMRRYAFQLKCLSLLYTKGSFSDLRCQTLIRSESREGAKGSFTCLAPVLNHTR